MASYLPLLLAAGLLLPNVVFAGALESANAAQDKPGKQHRFTIQDLPPPKPESESVRNKPTVIGRPSGAQLKVPAGFEVQEYATGFKNPRHLVTAPNGDIFVTESESGEIRVLRDTNNDGRPDQNEVFLGGLKRPFGVAFHPPGPEPKHLYVANTGDVVRVPYKTGDLKATGEPEKITDFSSGGQLTGGGHWTRDITFSPDGSKLYVSIGSKTNANKEKDPEEEGRARVFVMNADGSDKQVFATGLRNPVSISFHPKTGDLWSTVNERDEIGDDLVPDYVTRVQKGGFYGWPYSYLGNHPDPRHKENPHPELTAKAIVPDVLFEAHSAALNLVFYTGQNFPQDYHGDAFVALHGSWNRGVRTGYKVVRVPLKNGEPQGYYEDFMTGFVLPDQSVWGRPVGLTVAKDGALIVSEDGNDTLWRISARK